MKIIGSQIRQKRFGNNVRTNGRQVVADHRRCEMPGGQFQQPIPADVLPDPCSDLIYLSDFGRRVTEEKEDLAFGPGSIRFEETRVRPIAQGQSTKILMLGNRGFDAVSLMDVVKRTI